MEAFTVFKRTECDMCKGDGKIEHPDGDIEWCDACGRMGYWESEVAIEEAMAELGKPATNAAEKAAAALENMRFVFGRDRPADGRTDHALAAIAEQLALLNEHMAELADNASYYVANKV